LAIIPSYQGNVPSQITADCSAAEATMARPIAKLPIRGTAVALRTESAIYEVNIDLDQFGEPHLDLFAITP